MYKIPSTRKTGLKYTSSTLITFHTTCAEQRTEVFILSIKIDIDPTCMHNILWPDSTNRSGYFIFIYLEVDITYRLSPFLYINLKSNRYRKLPLQSDWKKDDPTLELDTNKQRNGLQCKYMIHNQHHFDYISIPNSVYSKDKRRPVSWK